MKRRGAYTTRVELEEVIPCGNAGWLLHVSQGGPSGRVYDDFWVAPDRQDLLPSNDAEYIMIVADWGEPGQVPTVIDCEEL